MSTALVDSYLTDPSNLETDPSRILSWSNVRNKEDVMVYYRQRLGPEFRLDLTRHALIIQPDAMDRLVNGTAPLMPRIAFKSPDALHDLQLFYTHTDPILTAIYLQIDDPSPGREFIELIEELAKTDEERLFGKMMIELSRAFSELHAEWVGRGKPYYRINRREPKGAVEREAFRI